MQLRTFALALALAGACGSSKKSGSGSSSGSSGASGAGAAGGSAAAAPARKQPLTAAFFGKVLAPFGPLAKVTFGSTEDDARKAAPEFFAAPGKGTPGNGFYVIDDPVVEGVQYGVSTYKGKVDELDVLIPPAAQALVDAAWGPGQPTTGGDSERWYDTAKHWRVFAQHVSARDQVKLEFTPYQPAAALLAGPGDTLAFAPDGILGATLAELRTRFPDTLVEEEPEHGGLRLELPPTEWSILGTDVFIERGGDGKVVGVSFSLSYFEYAPGKAALRALIEQKWGAAKDGTYQGDPALLFRDQAPFIAVVDNGDLSEWTVHVLAKKPR